MTKTKRSKPEKYFTVVTEQSIVLYAKSECQKEKERLYVDEIKPAFDELIEKIVFTYKFTHLSDLDSLKD